MFCFLVLKRPKLPLFNFFNSKESNLINYKHCLWSPGDLSLELHFVTLGKLLTLSEVQFAVCKIGIIVYHRVVTWIK